MTISEKKPWGIVALERAFLDLKKAADALCYSAQTSGGTAGRDEHLCAAIDHYVAERDKAQQRVRIVHFEWDDPEIGAGLVAADSPVHAPETQGDRHDDQ